MQKDISASDLHLILTLIRAQTLAEAANRYGVDQSTVFRQLQRLEKQLGQRLFERSRRGYLPSTLAVELARQAESIEQAMDRAHELVVGYSGNISGLVRINTLDTILNGLVLPALVTLQTQHPGLRFELSAGNDPSNLSLREVDIALRSTRQPPPNLIGKRLGYLDFAVYGSKALKARLDDDNNLNRLSLDHLPWIAMDKAMPGHPGVAWRKKQYPFLMPQYLVDSLASEFELVRQGLGVAVIASLHAHVCTELCMLTPPLSECTMELWMLMHPDARNMPHVKTVAQHVEQHIHRLNVLNK